MAWIDKLVGRSPIGPMQQHMRAAVRCAHQILPLVDAMAGLKATDEITPSEDGAPSLSEIKLDPPAAIVTVTTRLDPDALSVSMSEAESLLRDLEAPYRAWYLSPDVGRNRVELERQSRLSIDDSRENLGFRASWGLA